MWLDKYYIYNFRGDSTLPIWYNYNNKKIKLISEKSLYKNTKGIQKLKNSFVEQFCLSDLFIAGDDDYLLGSYTHQSDFFQ